MIKSLLAYLTCKVVGHAHAEKGLSSIDGLVYRWRWCPRCLDAYDVEVVHGA